jgi:hypothetical protein
MNPESIVTPLLVITGVAWMIGWAQVSSIAIKAVKNDGSFLAWDLEDQLPLIVLHLLFSWPFLALKLIVVLRRKR